MISSKGKLQATTIEQLVLGFLMSNLGVLHDPRTRLQIEDFGSTVNKVAFDILSTLANQGNDTADLTLVKSMGKDHPGLKNISFNTFEQAVGGLYENRLSFDFSAATLFSNIEVLKKYRVLRELVKEDFDVTPFIGEDSVLSKSMSRRLEESEIGDILTYYRNALSRIEDTLSYTKTKLYADAADGLRELVEIQKSTPAIGTLLDGHIFNSVTRGARFGRLYLNSAPTGFGKTRMMLGSAASLAMPYINNDGVLVIKDEGYNRVLMVPTEQDYQEIQTMLLAFVSGVNEERLAIGRTTTEEDKRIEQALQIIEAYRDNFHIEQIPDPSISNMKNTIIKHINRFNVEFVFFDYIASSPALTLEFANSRVREDVALIYMANALKEIATTQNVFVMSATQLTGEWMKAETRGTNLIRGSRGLADKIDLGAISLEVNGTEYSKVESIIEEMGFPRPNVVTDIYKNRAGSLKGVKIFRHFDHGTCRLTDLFMTDESHMLKTGYLEFVEDTHTETVEQHLEKKEKENELNGT